tara:strand:- start:1336 stop:1443 length:108 start_codon:yes stop_codon:yes gene_type:complete
VKSGISPANGTAELVLGEYRVAGVLDLGFVGTLRM